MSIFGFEITKTKLLVTAIIAAILMSHPVLRSIVWWILPLGSGWDDVVFIVAVAIIFIIGFTDFWTSWMPGQSYNRKKNK